MSCNICCDNFNQSRNCEVKCAHCQFSACRSCCQTYILDQTVAKCMNNNCEKEWTRKFLVDNFTKKFVSQDWKKNREKVLFDREKALLPATQGIVEERKNKALIKKEIEDVDDLIRDLRIRRADLETAYHRGGSVVVGQERRQFIRACPDEDCRGFLSSQWKCGTCSKWTCPDCHVVKGDRHDSEHTCNPADVETVKLLNQDTKPCPKCATGIYKIEGCDQMWCTQCHTAFSWRTGRIETRIHNPHFYEWQRRNNNGEAPRNVGDFVCGRELDYRSSAALCNNLRTKINFRLDGNGREPQSVRLLCRRIDRLVQSALHLQEVQLPVYNVDQVENNLNLRVEYLMKELSEEDFKVRVQRANKQHEKKREIGEVIHLYIQTVTDIVYRLNEYARNDEDLIIQGSLNRANSDEEREVISNKAIAMLDESLAIRDYANECLADIATTYGSKKKAIRIYCHEDIHYRGPREVLYSC